METWKLLLGVSVVLVLFGTVASVLSISLASPKGFGLLIGAIVGGVFFLVVSRRGYRIGRSIGEDVAEDE